jgi:hypothetical protein
MRSGRFEAGAGLGLVLAGFFTTRHEGALWLVVSIALIAWGGYEFVKGSGERPAGRMDQSD